MGMAQTQANPYVIYTADTFLTTARFVTSARHGSQHVPDWPQIIPKLRRFWEEYAKYSINFGAMAPIDGDRLRRAINEPSNGNYVLNELNECQRIKQAKACWPTVQQVLDNKLRNADVRDWMNRRYFADMQVDMQRDLRRAEERLTSTYHYMYKALKRAETEIWEEFLGRKQYKVRLSDEIRALCGEICEDMTRGDDNLYWV